MPIVYKCSDYFNSEGTEGDILERQENLKSCGNRCLKNVSVVKKSLEFFIIEFISLFSFPVDTAVQRNVILVHVLIQNLVVRKYAFIVVASI